MLQPTAWAPSSEYWAVVPPSVGSVGFSSKPHLSSAANWRIQHVSLGSAKNLSNSTHTSRLQPFGLALLMPACTIKTELGRIHHPAGLRNASGAKLPLQVLHAPKTCIWQNNLCHQGCQQLTEPNSVNRLIIGLTISLKVLAVGFRSRRFGSVQFLLSSVQFKTAVDYSWLSFLG